MKETQQPPGFCSDNLWLESWLVISPAHPHPGLPSIRVAWTKPALNRLSFPSVTRFDSLQPLGK